MMDMAGALDGVFGKRQHCTSCEADVEWVDPCSLAGGNRKWWDEVVAQFGREAVMQSEAWHCTSESCGAIGLKVSGNMVLGDEAPTSCPRCGSLVLMTYADVLGEQRPGLWAEEIAEHGLDAVDEAEAWRCISCDEVGLVLAG